MTSTYFVSWNGWFRRWYWKELRIRYSQVKINQYLLKFLLNQNWCIVHIFPKQRNCFPSAHWRARMPQWWERSPPTHAAQVRHFMWVDFVVGSCPCFESFFLQIIRFSSLHKNQHIQNPIQSRFSERIVTPWSHCKFHYLVLSTTIYLFETCGLRHNALDYRTSVVQWWSNRTVLLPALQAGV